MSEAWQAVFMHIGISVSAVAVVGGIGYGLLWLLVQFCLHPLLQKRRMKFSEECKIRRKAENEARGKGVPVEQHWKELRRKLHPEWPDLKGW